MMIEIISSIKSQSEQYIGMCVWLLICTYRCWGGGQWLGGEYFLLDAESEQVPCEAESPLSVPLQPLSDLPDGSVRSLLRDCRGGRSQTDGEEATQLKIEQNKSVNTTVPCSIVDLITLQQDFNLLKRLSS